jgi:DNA-binding transcriptional LysR family regulator
LSRRRHFGRAAEELFIAQPVLSRQVRRLEQELGLALIDRSQRELTLTPAGPISEMRFRKPEQRRRLDP